MINKTLYNLYLNAEDSELKNRLLNIIFDDEYSEIFAHLYAAKVNEPINSINSAEPIIINHQIKVKPFN